MLKKAEAEAEAKAKEAEGVKDGSCIEVLFLTPVRKTWPLDGVLAASHSDSQCRFKNGITLVGGENAIQRHLYLWPMQEFAPASTRIHYPYSSGRWSKLQQRRRAYNEKAVSNVNMRSYEKKLVTVWGIDQSFCGIDAVVV